MSLAKIYSPVLVSSLSKSTIVELQTLLNDIDNAGLVVDGIYGPNTAKAWRDFKTKHFRAHHEYISKDTASLLLRLAKEVDDPVKRQLKRGEKYGGEFKPKSTKTRYFSQRDNYIMPHRTCNSSSNAMYLDWILRATGHEGLSGDNEFLKKVLKYGDTIYHHIQTKVIKDYGVDSKWMTDRDLPFINNLLAAGFAIPVNILHRGSLARPRGGHVILLIAKKDKNFIAHDPYGTLLSNYSNHNGAFSRIPEHVFKRRWQGGYRILA